MACPGPPERRAERPRLAAGAVLGRVMQSTPRRRDTAAAGKMSSRPPASLAPRSAASAASNWRGWARARDGA